MSRPGSFKKNRLSHVSSIDEPSPDILPNISSTGFTVGGRGQGRGVTNSPWGNEFRDRKKFFERMKQSSTGDEDENFSPRQSYDPSPSHSGTTSPSRHSNKSSSRFMIDETGQKRVPHESQSSQSQSDGERDDPPTHRSSSNESDRERLSQIELTEEQIYLEEKGTSNKRLPSHFLDGRPVHKELDKVSGRDQLDGGRGQFSDGEGHHAKSDLEDEMMKRINSLLKEKNHVESKLQELNEKHQSVQRELNIQKRKNLKSQETANDMRKDIELLQEENLHLTESLSCLEKDRDELQSEKQELLCQYDSCEQRLIQMEKFYREAEEQNQTLDDELSSVLTSRDKLREEKNKLDQEVSESRKTKENFRMNIMKLREQNKTLEDKLSTVTREKSRILKDGGDNEKRRKELESKVSEIEKKMEEIERERSRILDQLENVDKDRTVLTEKLRGAEIERDKVRNSCEEVKKEKESLSKKLKAVEQRELSLKQREEKILKEISTSINNVLKQCPTIKLAESSTAQHSLPSEVTKLMSLHKGVISRYHLLQEEVKSLKESISCDRKRLEECELSLREKDEICKKLEKDKEELDKKTKEFESMEEKYQKLLSSYNEEKEEHNKVMNELIQANETLEEDIEEVSSSYHAILSERDELKVQLQEQQSMLHSEIGSLLAKRALISARLRLAMETMSKVSPPGEGMEQLEEIVSERERLKDEVKRTTVQYQESLQQVEVLKEEKRKSSLETDKMKVQLMTEISLLKSQVSSLEKDKSLLEMQVKQESTSSGPSSAFQLVTSSGGGGAGSRKVVIEQQDMFKLQQKVTFLENENKRLNDLIHTGSASGDTGNVLRRQNLEMKKKVFFLESEKKQLSEKVSSLHMSIKTMRESKDRMTHDRLRTLQEENTSLQDRIRNMEDQFTRKLMDADARIASTTKDNDMLRHKLNYIQESLKCIEKFNETLSVLATQVQSQEESLVSLKANLSGSGNTLSPIVEIMERVLKNHNDIQTLLSSQLSEESSRPPSVQRHSSTGHSTLPPVLQQFSREYISSLQGTTSPTHSGPGRVRSQSHSQGTPPTLSNQNYEVREKISQIFADNLSISNLIKHFQENLNSHHSEVCKLQSQLVSYQSELKQCVKVLDDAHNNLTLLWQQELPPEQLNAILILESQVENWQDKVYARDMALKDIDMQMKEDYESHNRRFSLLKSQVLDLKEEISINADALLAKDQYIHQIEERSLNAESELYKLRKEMERVLQEALNVPEGFQLQNHGGSVPELIRVQSEQLHHMKSVLNEYIFQSNQLEAKIESLHREKTLLQHQSIKMERQYQQTRDELHSERECLRKLVEQQLKSEDSGELIKLLKHSQETARDQKEFRKIATEMDTLKLAVLEKDVRISELQHQLDIQQLDSLKVLHHPPNTTGTSELSLSNKSYNLHGSTSRSFLRPHSASSAESARPPRYIITDPNHPKARNRNKLQSTLEGDFLIQLPPTTGGESVLNLSEKSDPQTSNGGYYLIGYPVVTDDEGGMTVNDDSSPKQPQKNRVRRHRRTASADSDSLKNFLSSGSSASDSRPPNLNQSSTLPLSVTRQHKPAIRPGSVDSMRFETQSPVGGENSETVKGEGQGGESQDAISQYAKGMQESIGEMISLTEREMTTPIEPPTSGAGAKGKKGEAAGGKPVLWFIPRLKGSGKQFGSGKGSGKEKGKGDTGGTKGGGAETTQDDESLDNISHLSRIPSLASSVGRSDSFVSNSSTTFSGLGGESSPYSTLSLDSLLIDSLDNMLQHPYTIDKYHRNAMFTPVVGPSYLHTSSSDEDSRSYSSGNRTLKRSTLSDKSSQGNFFQPVSVPSHHHTNSSCDSDQLLSSTTSYAPLHRSESISISDMDRELTDQEDVQEKILSLQKQLGKARRSSTGSIIICNNSGSSMEDIKTAIY